MSFYDYSSFGSPPPNTVAIGGGTGLSTMLRGLKRYTNRLTAIVTVADDGGGSGVLREELGMPPPGDIRNCLRALANTEPTMDALLDYRFTEGSLKGQSFGNLFLAALNGMCKSFDEAVMKMGEVLALTGRVLPVSNADTHLIADFANGASIFGESKISDYKKQSGDAIARVRLLPDKPPALPETLDAIRDADLLIIGPGSLYTSIIPNLLTDGVSDAIAASSAVKIYVLNVMTQPGETEGYTASEHIRAVFLHSQENLFDFCLINTGQLPHQIIERYGKEFAGPTITDDANVRNLGVVPVYAAVADSNGNYARHDPVLLADALMDVFRKNQPSHACT